MVAVTVLMPAFNAERFAAKAIASILRQSFRDFELIVVDDGSTDATRDVIASFRDARLRLIANPANLGIAAALNLGLVEARAPLVARMDADDVAHRDRLLIQTEFFGANPAVALAGTQVRLLGAFGPALPRPGWWRAESENGIAFQSMLDNPFTHSTVMFRRTIVCEELGGYDESFLSAQDYELWSRVMARHPVRNLPRALVALRRHRASVSATYDDNHLARSSVIVARNICRLLGDAVSDADVRLIAAMHGNPRARAIVDRRIIDVVMLLFERFGSADRDVRRVAAAKLGQIAVLLAPRDRAGAAEAFRHARALDLRTAIAFAPRVVM